MPFSMGSPCLQQDKLHSDKTKQAFSKESYLDSLAGIPRFSVTGGYHYPYTSVIIMTGC